MFTGIVEELGEVVDRDELADAARGTVRGPLGPASKFQIEEIIDPRDTRRLVCEWVENAHQIASRPDRLGPRARGFRP